MSRTVLVTGAAGFIGSHLVEALAARGDEVRAFVRYNSAGATGFLSELPAELRGRVRVVAGDVRDAEAVDAAVRGCAAVFHLAALISIPYSYEAPESYVDVNVRGTLNVLQACRRHGARLVHTSTSEVYGTPDTVPITEEHPLRAQSPYAATKVGADQLVLSFHRSFGMPAVVLRPFNTYGPRQSTRAVLPQILVQLLAGRPEVRLGATTPRRDLTFVTDTVDGFVRAAESDAALGQVVQLGTGRDVSIGELAKIAMRALGREVPVVCEAERLRPDASEVMVLQSSPALARALLGWEPKVALEEGLRLTAEWLRARAPELAAQGYRA